MVGLISSSPPLSYYSGLSYYEGQNTTVRIGLVKPIEPSDTLNYKLLFKDLKYLREHPRNFTKNVL